jgi:hypothetical protein
MKETEEYFLEIKRISGISHLDKFLIKTILIRELEIPIFNIHDIPIESE